MSKLAHSQAHLGEQFCPPRDEPSRAPASTFEDQRFVPRPPPSVQFVNGGAEHVFHDVTGAPSPSHAAFFHSLRPLEDNIGGRGRETSARNAQNSAAEYAGLSVYPVKHRVAACLHALKNSLWRALRRLVNATMRTVSLLMEEVRDRVPEWAPLTRHLLN